MFSRFVFSNFPQYFSILRSRKRKQISYWSSKAFFSQFENQNEYYVKFMKQIGKKCDDPITICKKVLISMSESF